MPTPPTSSKPPTSTHRAQDLARFSSTYFSTYLSTQPINIHFTFTLTSTITSGPSIPLLAQSTSIPLTPTHSQSSPSFSASPSIIHASIPTLQPDSWTAEHMNQQSIPSVNLADAVSHGGAEAPVDIDMDAISKDGDIMLEDMGAFINGPNMVCTSTGVTDMPSSPLSFSPPLCSVSLLPPLYPSQPSSSTIGAHGDANSAWNTSGDFAPHGGVDTPVDMGVGVMLNGTLVDMDACIVLNGGAGVVLPGGAGVWVDVDGVDNHTPYREVIFGDGARVHALTTDVMDLSHSSATLEDFGSPPVPLASHKLSYFVPSSSPSTDPLPQTSAHSSPLLSPSLHDQISPPPAYDLHNNPQFCEPPPLICSYPVPPSNSRSIQILLLLDCPLPPHLTHILLLARSH
ncbi:hypothetical protein CPB84DRAFT_1859285 [Gymnopilus junonius]|uniref:Uncharacterized protein n=1 Tax=Gymnopilus junonius TaxID=109634 RepID=A0A9P5TFE7_GYMJU|nr:hypothetical protein CPB84DRAFT_1859285 [Gymnopilus junonius]